MARLRADRQLPCGAIGEYSGVVSSVEEIRTAIRRLPKKELERLRRWFDKYDAGVWDRQIEEDVAAGRLDAWGREALREHRAGRTKAL
jgi:hypothetical protein